MHRPGSSDEHKLIFLGESQVGKTSIIHKGLHGTLQGSSTSTIGCVSATITVRIRHGPVTLQVWDTAGQEVYRSLVHIYVRGARLAIIVVDVTERTSLDAVDQRLEVVRTGLPAMTPVFLVANKIDLVDEIEVPEDELKRVADANSLRLFRTSAKTGEGIGEVFEDAAEIVAGTPPPIGVREYGQAARIDLAGRRTCCSDGPRDVREGRSTKTPLR
jgi:small GTP-binding protein